MRRFNSALLGFAFSVLLLLPIRPALAIELTDEIKEQYQFNQYDQKAVILIPKHPLSMDTEINWEAGIEKKLIPGKTNAGLKITQVGPNGFEEELISLNTGQVRTGRFTLPKGFQLKIDLYTGKYQFLLKKSGADSYFRVRYRELVASAEELPSLYRFRFNANGFAEVDRWVWNFGDGNELSEKEPIHTFSTPGRYLLRLTGFKGKQKIQSLEKELYVPDFAEVNPELSPLEGAIALQVQGKANLKTHYDQQAICTWDFGDGSSVINGNSVTHTYQKIGRFTVTLTVRTAITSRVLVQTWQVTSKPMYIVNQAFLSPLEGVVPLVVKGKADPIYEGWPIDIRYSWDFGDGSVSNNAQFEYTYTKPGEYILTLDIYDENHPDIKVAPLKYIVIARPPIIQIDPIAYPQQGVIPLIVGFTPNLYLEGSPTNIEYSWDFGDGSKSNDAEPTHVYEKPGIYEVTLNVREKIHEIELNTTLRVVTYEPRIVAEGNIIPSQGEAPLTVTCMAAPIIEGEFLDLWYEWEFSDGQVAFGQKVDRTFKLPGTYTVTLRIKDVTHGGTGLSSEKTYTIIVDSD